MWFTPLCRYVHKETNKYPWNTTLFIKNLNDTACFGSCKAIFWLYKLHIYGSNVIRNWHLNLFIVITIVRCKQYDDRILYSLRVP